MKTVRFKIAPEILVRAETLECETPCSSFSSSSSLSTSSSSTSSSVPSQPSRSHAHDLPESLSFGNSVPFSLCEAVPSFWNTVPCPVVCYHDGEPFSGKALSMPLSFNAKTKVFSVWGAFCSPGCMKRYARERAGLSLPKNKILGLMKLMFVMVYKLRGRILQNPPREYLKKYNINGKGLSVEEFRKQGTMGIHIDFVPDCFVFTPVAVCTQKIMTPEEMTSRMAQVDILDKIKSKRIANPPRTTMRHDLTTFYPLATSAVLRNTNGIKEEEKEEVDDEGGDDDLHADDDDDDDDLEDDEEEDEEEK